MFSFKKTYFISFLFIPLLSSLIIYYFVGKNYNNYIISSLLCSSSAQKSHQPLKYLPLALSNWNPNDSLGTIKKVFDTLGIERVVNDGEKEVDKNLVDSTTSWDILWSLEFPFDHFEDLIENFTGGQIINHIPGITYITNKKYLSTSTISKYIPPSFDLPHLKNEFLFYSRSFPEKRFVVKNFDNRGVYIIDPEKIDFQLGNER
jgi:hypothetical protein